MKCSVFNCRNTVQRLSFFSFPKCPRARKKWVKFCENNKVLDQKNPVVCSMHFNSGDIQNNRTFQMGYVNRRTLRTGAVPCIRNEFFTDADVGDAGSDDLELADLITVEKNPLTIEEHVEQKRNDQLVKCRTCFENFVIDDKSGNLDDLTSKVLLYQIEVITGVWIDCQDDLPHHICSTCVDSLRQAIDFRETCLLAQLKFKQALEADLLCAEVEETETKFETEIETKSEKNNSNAESIPLLEELSYMSWSEFGPQSEEWPTHLVDYQDDEAELISEIKDEEETLPEPKPEPHTDEKSMSLSLGRQIYKEYLHDKDSVEPQTKPNMQYDEYFQDWAVVQEPKEKKPKQTPPTKIVSEELADKRRDQNRKYREKRLKDPPRFICDQCGMKFRLQSGLRDHSLRHTNTKNYTCPNCPMKFFDSYKRNIHVRVVHNGERPYACNYCSETYVYPYQRQQHESKVHGAAKRINYRSINPKSVCKRTLDNRYQCHICNKSYVNRSALKWHINSHTGDRPYKCTVCSKGFFNPNLLKQHENSVHNIRRPPFECTQCLKGFHVRKKLEEHLLVHTGERPYKCEICNVTFRYKHNIYSHKKSKMHSDNLRKGYEK